MKNSVFLTVLLGLLFVSTAVAQEPGDTLWTRTYGGDALDDGRAVAQTADGGYIIAAQTTSFGAGGYDFYLVKTDAFGEVLWTRVYGGSENDMVFSVQQTSDGGYIFAGFTYSFGAGSCDAYLMKTDALGDTLWTRTYGGVEADCAYSVCQTSDGGYALAGNTSSFGAGGFDVYLVKTDAAGEMLWQQTYGGEGLDDSRSLELTSDGGYIIAGFTMSFGAAFIDAYVVRTDADGNELWYRLFGGAGQDMGFCVRETRDEGYAVGISTDSFGAGILDMYLVRTDSNGDSLWTRTYGGSLVDQCNSVQETMDGGFILGGSTNSFGAGGFDIYFVKTDADGDTLWTRTYGGSDDNEVALGVHQTTDAGYILVGGTGDYYSGIYDVYLVRVAGKGLEIMPDDLPPVTVPQGGSFGFTGILTNNTEDPQVTDAWTMAVGPQKDVYGPFKVRYDLQLEPYQSRSAHFNQRVPNLAPLGFYDYVAYCGDYPSTVIDSSFFQIEVVPATFATGEDLGWFLTGSFDRNDGFASVPSNFALLGNYPNPFNASTTIRYELPASAHVKVEVYNLFGQRVVTLVNGEQEAGYISITWDASEVSSGIYFYRLTAGDFTETKRMMLVK